MSRVTERLEGQSVEEAINHLEKTGRTPTDIHTLLSPENDSASEAKEGELRIDENIFKMEIETGVLDYLIRTYRRLKQKVSRYEKDNGKYPLCERVQPEELEELKEKYGDLEIGFY